MARPLRGTLTRTATGWRVEVPSSPGSPTRRRYTFDDEGAARAWRQAAIEALRNGHRPPEPSSGRSGELVTFGDFASAWHREEYGLGNHAGAERARAVEKDLLMVCAYLDGLGYTPATLTREVFQRVLRQWAGTEKGPLNKRLGPRQCAAGIDVEGYAQDIVNDRARTLTGVLTFAREVGRVTLQFDPALVRVPRSTRPKPRAVAPLTLKDTAVLCGQLHAVHAFALLLMRVMGLRISEAYGLRVGDFRPVADDDNAVLFIRRQGGKEFLERGVLGQDRATTSRETTKTPSSVRILPVPASLELLIELVIQVFHTDPVTGQVDPARSLIPELNETKNAQNALRTAVATAAKSAGLVGIGDIDQPAFDAPVGIRPHDMRRSIITDMAHASEPFTIELRERWVGHRPGDTVHAGYVLDSPEMRELARIARQIEEAIDAQLPDGLVIPTTKRCTTRSQRALHADAARIDAMLADAGWLVTADDVSDILDSGRLAQLLGIAAGTARRLLASGEITTVPLPGGRPDQRGIRVADATELYSTWTAGVPVAELAEELGRSVASIHQKVNAEDWGMTRRGRISILSDSVADKVRAWHAQLQADREHGMGHAEAARLLDVPVSVVRNWATKRVLIPLEGRTGYVTRDSVASLAAQRSSSRRRRTR